MKKQIIAIMALAFTYQMANAQTEKGRQNLGLNLGFLSVKNTAQALNSSGVVTSSQDFKNTTFSIAPSYSYFIANGLDLGAEVGYGVSNQSSPSGSSTIKQDINSFSAALYLRKYVLFADRFGFRTGGRLGYGHSTTKYTYPAGVFGFNNEGKTNDYAVGGLFDLVYYPSKKLGLAVNVASLTYQHSTTDYSATSKNKIDAFAFNFIDSGLQMSVFYTFGGK